MLKSKWAIILVSIGFSGCGRDKPAVELPGKVFYNLKAKHHMMLNGGGRYSIGFVDEKTLWVDRKDRPQPTAPVTAFLLKHDLWMMLRNGCHLPKLRLMASPWIFQNLRLTACT